MKHSVCVFSSSFLRESRNHCLAQSWGISTPFFSKNDLSLHNCDSMTFTSHRSEGNVEWAWKRVSLVFYVRLFLMGAVKLQIRDTTCDFWKLWEFWPNFCCIRGCLVSRKSHRICFPNLHWIVSRNWQCWKWAWSDCRSHLQWCSNACGSLLDHRSASAAIKRVMLPVQNWKSTPCNVELYLVSSTRQNWACSSYKSHLKTWSQILARFLDSNGDLGKYFLKPHKRMFRKPQIDDEGVVKLQKALPCANEYLVNLDFHHSVFSSVFAFQHFAIKSCSGI